VKKLIRLTGDPAVPAILTPSQDVTISGEEAALGVCLSNRQTEKAHACIRATSKVIAAIISCQGQALQRQIASFAQFLEQHWQASAIL
jgi:hypothetical protein